MNIKTHKLIKLETRWDVTTSWVCEICGLDLDLIAPPQVGMHTDDEPPSIYYEWKEKSKDNWIRSYEQKIPSCSEVLMNTALE